MVLISVFFETPSSPRDDGYPGLRGNGEHEKSESDLHLLLLATTCNLGRLLFLYKVSHDQKDRPNMKCNKSHYDFKAGFV